MTTDKNNFLKQVLKFEVNLKAPLKSKGEYLNTRTNQQERITLLGHQTKFIRKLNLSNV